MTSARIPILAIASVVWILDQFTKQLAQVGLADGPVRIIGSFLQLRLTSNSGAAFSFGANTTWVFTLLASAIVVGILWKAHEVAHIGWMFGVGGLLGGALGNLTDRLFRSPGFPEGHVVDFIALPNFPIFNVADIFITCSVALMFWLSFRGVPWERTHE